jgi:hypothetical protein
VLSITTVSVRGLDLDVVVSSAGRSDVGDVEEGASASARASALDCGIGLDDNPASEALAAGAEVRGRYRHGVPGVVGDVAVDELVDCEPATADSGGDPSDDDEALDVLLESEVSAHAPVPLRPRYPPLALAPLPIHRDVRCIEMHPSPVLLCRPAPSLETGWTCALAGTLWLRWGLHIGRRLRDFVRVCADYPRTTARRISSERKPLRNPARQSFEITSQQRDLVLTAWIQPTRMFAIANGTMGFATRNALREST